VNKNLTENERLDLVGKNMQYFDARKDYFKRLDKKINTRTQLIDQKKSTKCN